MFFDKQYIDSSLFILRQFLGKTFPNPPVVALLVEHDKNFKDHKIVSFGITGESGRPHAEAVAIQNFKFNSRKKYTLYSTLEPCSHKGRGNSCTSEILKSKIHRVVFCLLDPDFRVRGKGLKILKQNGIEVFYGLMEKEAYKIYEGYFFNRIKKRPLVTVKFATSLDGKISKKKNNFSQITNKKSQKYLHIIRSMHDAVLVGSNTVRIDDCILTSRLEGLNHFSPIRVILNRKFDLPKNKKIFKDAKKYRTIIFTEKKNHKKISKKDFEVIEVEKKQFNLKFILEELAKIGVCNLLVEGGAKIFNSFLHSKYCDKIMIFRGNFFIGEQGLDALSSNNDIKKSNLEFNLIALNKFEQDHLEIFEKTRNSLILK